MMRTGAAAVAVPANDAPAVVELDVPVDADGVLDVVEPVVLVEADGVLMAVEPLELVEADGVLALEPAPVEDDGVLETDEPVVLVVPAVVGLATGVLIVPLVAALDVVGVELGAGPHATSAPIAAIAAISRRRIVRLSIWFLLDCSNLRSRSAHCVPVFDRPLPRTGGREAGHIGGMTSTLLRDHNVTMITALPRQDADELIAFLGRLGHGVEVALRARHALLSELVAARRDPPTALDRAGLASRRCVRAFDEALLQLNQTRVPSVAAECVFELREWLEAHLAACDHLSRAALARDRDDLERAIEYLAGGASSAHRFNDARSRLLRRLAS
jgi:hypothetical protein